MTMRLERWKRRRDRQFERDAERRRARRDAASAKRMKVYVASSWRRTERHDEIVTALRAAGHEVYDYRKPHFGPGERGVGFHWSEVDPGWEAWTADQYRHQLLLLLESCMNYTVPLRILQRRSRID